MARKKRHPVKDGGLDRVPGDRSDLKFHRGRRGSKIIKIGGVEPVEQVPFYLYNLPLVRVPGLPLAKRGEQHRAACADRAGRAVELGFVHPMKSG